MKRLTITGMILAAALAGCFDQDTGSTRREALAGLDPAPAPGETSFSYAYMDAGAPRIPENDAITVHYHGPTDTIDAWGQPTRAHQYTVRHPGLEDATHDLLVAADDLRPLGIVLTHDERPARYYERDIGHGPLPSVGFPAISTMFYVAAAGSTIAGHHVTLVAIDAPMLPAADCEAYDLQITPPAPFAPKIEVCLAGHVIPVWAAWRWQDGRTEVAAWRPDGFQVPAPTAAAPVDPPTLMEPWHNNDDPSQAWAPPMGVIENIEEAGSKMTRAIAQLPSYQAWAPGRDVYPTMLHWRRDLSANLLGVETNGLAMVTLASGGEFVQYYDSVIETPGSEISGTFVPVPPGQPDVQRSWSAPARTDIGEGLVPLAAAADHAFAWPDEPNMYHWTVAYSKPINHTWPGRAAWIIVECFGEPHPFFMMSAVNGQLLWDGWTEIQENGACGYGWVNPAPRIEGGQKPDVMPRMTYIADPDPFVDLRVMT